MIRGTIGKFLWRFSGAFLLAPTLTLGPVGLHKARRTPLRKIVRVDRRGRGGRGRADEARGNKEG